MSARRDDTPEIVVVELSWFRQPAVRAEAAAAGMSESQLIQRAKDEANGLAGWSAWCPGVLSGASPPLPKGSNNLRVNVAAAIAVAFQLT